MKLQGYKRIITEDFEEEEQSLISKLGYVINSALDNIFQALNKNITIQDNLNQSLIDLSVKVSASGIPLIPTQIKYDLKTSCKGIIVISIVNETNISSYPSSTPFVTFEQTSSNLLTIKHISNLTANNSYSLRLLLIGG